MDLVRGVGSHVTSSRDRLMNGSVVVKRATALGEERRDLSQRLSRVVRVGYRA